MTASDAGNMKKRENFIVRRKSQLGGIDLTFFFIVMTLLVIGIVMMFSASYAWAVSKNQDGTFYAVKQMKFAAIGVVIMIALTFFDYHWFQNKIFAYGLYVVSLILLCLVFLFEPANGAQRWIYIGSSFSFQPSEIMKFSITILFSYLISLHYEKMNTFKYGIAPYLAMLAVVAVLMLKQPHLSGTLLICTIGIALIFVGGANVKHFLAMILAGLGAIALFVIYKTVTGELSYFTTRFQSWLDPFSDINDKTWQTCQSLIAIGSGGMFGLGLGESRQKYLYLPETQNDFVFAIICEELGFVGAVTVIMLFVLFVFRGLYIASKAPDKFGMLVAVGLTVQVGIQAFLNIAVVSNFIPNTGISLPFFSYGGTSLVMLLAQMGILLNISRHSVIEK
jgi:cell division protein FtsW